MSDTTPMESTEEGRAFLQRRVRGAAAFGAWVGLSFLIYRTIMAFVANHMQEFTHPSFLSHATGMLCLAFTWAVCRTGKRSVSVIRHSETFGFLGTAVAYSAMTLHITPYEMPHYIVLLSLQGVFVARAIYVPSTARRALTLTIAAGIPVLIVTYLMYRNHDFTYTDDPYLTGRPSDSVALTIVGFATAFWTVCVVLCWGASKVIYGLRKNVRDAKRLGQYELLEKIGEGGMGAVYRARHAMLRRPTAVKLLPLEKAGEKSIKRFEREVQETARLTHPNTIRIFDYGRTPDGVFYYVMELLEGATLEDIVAVDGPQPAARVAYVLEQACRALGEAHDAGLVHRDIKPSNIMVVERGGEHDVAKVLDFGLVKDMNPGDTPSMSMVGTIAGTPQYMPPEAITTPESVDARSDIYALGAVAYYLLVGENVFAGKNVVEVCSQHLHSEPVPVDVRAPDVPRELADVVMQCLAKSPDDRPAHAKDIARAVRALATQWTDADAERWWAESGAEVQAQSAAETASGRTLEVDLTRRAAMP